MNLIEELEKLPEECENCGCKTLGVMKRMCIAIVKKHTDKCVVLASDVLKTHKLVSRKHLLTEHELEQAEWALMIREKGNRLIKKLKALTRSGQHGH